MTSADGIGSCSTVAVVTCVVTRSLKAYLESFPDLEVAGVAASGEELLGRLFEWKPQVVLQDLLMPGGIDGMFTTWVASEPAMRALSQSSTIGGTNTALGPFIVM